MSLKEGAKRRAQNKTAERITATKSKNGSDHVTQRASKTQKRVTEQSIHEAIEDKSSESAEARSPRCWVGIDGSRHGWCVALLHEGKATADGPTKGPPCLKSIELLLCPGIDCVQRLLDDITRRGEECIKGVAIDMPIGLPEHAQRGGRACDRAARQVLAAAKARADRARVHSEAPLVGPSSIFTPPSRPALCVYAQGATHKEVTDANRRSARAADGNRGDGAGLGLSIQSYHIMSKILELDTVLQKKGGTGPNCPGHLDVCASLTTSAKNSVCAFECHPELAFLALRCRQATSTHQIPDLLQEAIALHSKKMLIGRQERVHLLRHHLDSTLDQDGEASEAVLPWPDWSDLQTHSYRMLPMLPGTPEQNNASSSRKSVATDDVLDALVCAVSAMQLCLGPLSIIGTDRNTLNKVSRDGRGLPMIIAV